MTDEKIIDLYFSRNESAIAETSTKYGRMLTSLSYGILSSVPDAEECVNDTIYAPGRLFHRPSHARFLPFYVKSRVTSRSTATAKIRVSPR